MQSHELMIAHSLGLWHCHGVLLTTHTLPFPVDEPTGSFTSEEEVKGNAACLVTCGAYTPCDGVQQEAG